MIPTRIGQDYLNGTFVGFVCISNRVFGIAANTSDTALTFTVPPSVTYYVSKVDGYCNTTDLKQLGVIEYSAEPEWYVPSITESELVSRNLRRTYDCNQDIRYSTNECSCASTIPAMTPSLAPPITSVLSYRLCNSRKLSYTSYNFTSTCTIDKSRFWCTSVNVLHTFYNREISTGFGVTRLCARSQIV